MTLTTSNYTVAEHSSVERPDGRKPSSTPTIVGVVVGVVAGLVLLGLGLWWYLRRRRRSQRQLEVMAPEPYTVDGGQRVTTVYKPDLAEASPSRTPSVHTRQSSLSDTDSNVDGAIGRIDHADDGTEIVEFLPPQYQEDWQVAPESMPEPEAAASEQNATGAIASREATQPSATLKDEYRVLIPGRPALKQEYSRAFGREARSEEQNILKDSDRPSFRLSLDGPTKENNDKP